jgi:hypothetical protein
MTVCPRGPGCRQTGEVEIRLDGGNAGGAVRAGDTVRRAAGPWTPSVHALLAHLAGRGFAGSPRPLGVDEQGREVLTFLAGESVGSARPWPEWVYAEDTLVQVAHWMRGFHHAVADFVPSAEAVWRMGGQWFLRAAARSARSPVAAPGSGSARHGRPLGCAGYPGQAAERLIGGWGCSGPARWCRSTAPPG